jgi:nicotinate phosphoribosyltransferase
MRTLASDPCFHPELGDLAQAAVAFAHGRHLQKVTCEFSICTPPTGFNYLIYSGLAPLLEQLENWKLTAEQVEYLRYHPAFASVPLPWLEHLATLRFTGDVWSLPEGTHFWVPAPALRITAPFEQAVLITTTILGTVTSAIRVASKVGRLLSAAEGRQLIEMGGRHARSAAEATMQTRSAYLAGMLTTTNAEAARQLGLPTHVLMPHDWPMLLGDEVEAFHRFGLSFSTMSIPVCDSFDSLTGVKHAIASGAPLQAIRFDSGDHAALSVEARKLLDQANRRHVKIIASGNLNEDSIARLVKQRAPIDGFAVGSCLETGTLNSVYKLVACQESDNRWEPIAQLAIGKRHYPHAKLIYRMSDDAGSFAGDVIAMEGEQHEGEALLHPVMHNGARTSRLPSLEEARDYCLMQRIRLPADLLDLSPQKPGYPVRYSDSLEREMTRLTRLRAKQAL